MEEEPGPAADRFCDLVMKGGIASGIVYPKAIARLSRHYRFKNIGGSSAGAIAAVITAAAEYQRRQTGSAAGFDRIAQLPEHLAETHASGKTRLLSLFQPQPGTRRLFAVLAASLSRCGAGRRIINILAGLLRVYWPATLLALVIALAVGSVQGQWLTASLVLIIALVALVGTWLYLDLTRALVGNGYGLCTGMTEDGSEPALTPWLHEQIQSAAGRTVNDAPLTFGELWRAKGFPPDWLGRTSAAPIRSIDLQMFSTNLAHGRPYIFPLPQGLAAPEAVPEHERLFFRAGEMARYLPPDVVRWMTEHSPMRSLPPGVQESASTDREPDLLALPPSEDLPVLLAARMSLAFPGLFSAIPLYAVDDNVPQRPEVRRCWFSDGGISSNFPIHLFDSFVPMWPTFGINLEPTTAGPEEVFVPRNYWEGIGEQWALFDERATAASRLGGFAAAVAGTMQNWNDNALARMPGVRDRIARVRLHADEGGLNLDMKPELIKKVAERGERAAIELIRRFAMHGSEGGEAQGWDAHRFVRFHLLLKMVESRANGLSAALHPTGGHAAAMADLVDLFLIRQNDRDNGHPLPPGYTDPMTGETRDIIREWIRLFAELDRSFAGREREVPFQPVPVPELRVRPPL